MDLLLWRHAQAEDPAPGQTDAERKLTGHGQTQAQKMAKWILHHGPSKLEIRVSPAQRTLQTGQALNQAFLPEARLTTEGSLESHVDVIRELLHKPALLLVGHQPTLGQLAAFLMTGEPSRYWDIPKGGLWWFTLRPFPAERGLQTSLKAVIAPKLL